MMQRAGFSLLRRPTSRLSVWNAAQQTRSLFTPIPVSYDIRDSSCAEPLMSKETFQRHYFDIYLPLFKRLNHLASESEHKDETCLLNVMRNTLDSPGETDLYNAAANVHNHMLFFENLENRHHVDYNKMSESSKQKILDNFTSMERLQHEFLCHAEAMYGSGWIWLVDRRGALEVVSTHDNYSAEATADSVTTILCLDMWEHSFWKDFGIRKELYLENFWKNVNWKVVDERLHKADANNEVASRLTI